METKIGYEPAFPGKSFFKDENGIGGELSFYGMSKRFYAACEAMKGLLAANMIISRNKDIDMVLSPKIVIEMSYELADELLKQEYAG